MGRTTLRDGYRVAVGFNLEPELTPYCLKILQSGDNFREGIDLYSP